MNYPLFRPTGTPDLVDILLADVAIRVQLSRTDYDKAVDRFGTMQDWIDREGSPLRGLVTLMYPQGSMAVGSTVARVSEKDEFDIDVIVDLDIRHAASPEVVLDNLHHAIRGEPGSRYWGKTTRHTRCVCVSYEDGMHIDLTPAVRVARRLDRTSVIFHSKPEDANVPEQHLLANPWGMADWFKSHTKIDADFASFYEQRSANYYGRHLQARAPAEGVPDRTPAHQKSRALIVLQLMKRWRNVLFCRNDRANLRRPPSVLLTKLVGDNANRTHTLSEELEHQASCILARFEVERSLGRLICEVNPRCHEDVLTDRWPANQFDQELMIEDLRTFVAQVRLLRSGTMDLAGISRLLEEMFGQRPVRRAVDDYVAAMVPSAGCRAVTTTGRVLTGSVASTAGFVTPVRSHSFYGD